jgi:hypothetical protein
MMLTGTPTGVGYNFNATSYHFEFMKKTSRPELSVIS